MTTQVVKKKRLRAWSGYAVGLLLGIVVWQVVGLHMSSETFVPLTTTLHRLGQLVADGTLPGALWTSFRSYLVGMAFALVLGAFLGLLLARRRLLRTAFEPYVVALYATPMVGVIPFLLALLGFGFWSKVVVIVVFAFFPVLLNTQRGAQSIDQELLDVARCYRSGEWDVWRHVIIPYTLPYLMTGVRQSLARGLVGMIAADYFLSSDGLGSLLITASERFDTAEMLAVTLTITVIGLILMAIGRLAESYFARWRVGG
ncbi:MAG TPA: ABC transporter permease subunit [Pseudonocardiaceae bacterium]|nr:ABC transporter permease subunit [Pseudonocardiaceae bacterium]